MGSRGGPADEGQDLARPLGRPQRLAAVRKEAGDAVELFTDANGALSRKAALYWAHRFAGEWDVCWFEEPVSSLDIDGLRLLRDRGPAGLDTECTEGATDDRRERFPYPGGTREDRPLAARSAARVGKDRRGRAEAGAAIGG